MPSNNDTILSKAITFLRFPLIVAVVFIHSDFNDLMVNGTLLVSAGQFPIYDSAYHLVSNELARIAVPLFFFISGFLFFYHSDFSKKTYVAKLKKRSKTLLIPYVFWNLLVASLLLAVQLLFPSITSGRTGRLIDNSWLDWLGLLWTYRDGYPVCFQLWFIRDLIVVVLFSPIIYYLLKYCKVLGIIALGSLWLSGLWQDVPGFGVTAFFFFSLGAWFSISQRDFTVDFSSMRWTATLIYVALVALDTWLWNSQVTDAPYVKKIGIIVGIVTVISWTAYGIKENRIQPNAFLAGSSFFVYAYHGMFISFVIKCYAKLLFPIEEWMLLVGYILIPLLTVGIGVCIYALLRKYFPTLTALITGGR